MNYRVTTNGQKGGLTAATVTIDRGPQLGLDFDLTGGQKAKEQGIKRASAGKHRMIRYIRERLEKLYMGRLHDGEEAFVTADDARYFLRQYYGGAVVPKGGNNFMGSIFRDGKWVRTGRFVPSLVKSNNARLIPCWRLKDEVERSAV